MLTAFKGSEEIGHQAIKQLSLCFILFLEKLRDHDYFVNKVSRIEFCVRSC